MVNPDFVMIARAYGIEAEDVERRADLNGAIERMMATDGPYLLNVMVDEQDMVFPMTPNGCAVDYIMLNTDEVYSPDMNEP